MPAPWVIDGRRELWVRPSVFARIVNRSEQTVRRWLKDGETLAEFGYESYRDPLGAWFVRISETEFLSVRRRKSVSNNPPISNSISR